MLDVEIHRIGCLDFEEEYEYEFRYLDLETVANGCFFGNLKFTVGHDEYTIKNTYVFLLALDLHVILTSLLQDDHSPQKEVIIMERTEKLYLNASQNFLFIEIKDRANSYFSITCDLIEFYRATYAVLRKLIFMLYDNRPELAKYELLDPYLFNSLFSEWTKSQQNN